METAWTFRIVLIMAFAVIIFGDFLGYGNAKKSDHHPHTNDLVDHQQQQHPLGGLKNIERESKNTIRLLVNSVSIQSLKFSRSPDDMILCLAAFC